MYVFIEMTYPSIRGASVSILRAVDNLLGRLCEGSPLSASGTPTPTPAVTATRNTSPTSHQCFGLSSPGAETRKFNKKLI